jgi:radical SAM superfamily enzyme YgiQ (UPF0313 family)
MRRAGFRVLGFGIENFSRNVLAEFNKAHIHDHIEPVLNAALSLGITPFLDIILSSPRSTLSDVAETLRECLRWLRRGCEIGIYPYVIPFSGSALGKDPALRVHTVSARQRVCGTNVQWDQPVKILPIDPEVRSAIVSIERNFEAMLAAIAPDVVHVPSRLRSLIWIACSLPVMAEHGFRISTPEEIAKELDARLAIARRTTTWPSVAAQ